MAAQSPTVAASGPMWSSDQARVSTPARDTLPKVGFSPAIPQTAAGILIDPPVSLPSAIGTTPAATAAPDPPLDPPGTRAVSQGLAAGGLKTPQASSWVVVLPTITAPASRSRATTAASWSLGSPGYAGDPHRVGRPAMWMMSLMPTGTPVNGPAPFPELRIRSACSAARIAPSRSTRAKALSRVSV